jgi:xanthine dehydrogenase large subunit
VTGRAEYTDDITEPAGCLHAYIGGATIAHGHITALDLSAVRAAPDVVAVLTAADIPGRNDISPTGLMDEPIFTADLVQFHGQPIFAVVAATRDAARRACGAGQDQLCALAPCHRYR